jgi:hypothetical protein
LFNTLFTLRFGGREIGLHSYGVLIAVGLAAGIVVSYREGRRRGFDGGRVLDAAFWMIVAGLVGSRIVYGIVNAGDFARACVDGGGGPRSAGAVVADCARILAIWQGGLVFYGGGSRGGRAGRSRRSAICSRRRWRWATRSGGSAASPRGAASARRAAGRWRSPSRAGRSRSTSSPPTASSRSAGTERPACIRRSSTRRSASWRSSRHC